MQKTKLRKRLQRGLALLAISSFVLMPVNLACAANNITAGSSAVGDMTNISGGNANVTDITSGFVHNGTGMNHFGNFDIGTGGTANLRGADRYINMVDKGININGILNSFNSGNLPANVMFISPEGMAVGAGGVLNVGGLQVITPATTDYTSLIGKLNFNGKTYASLTDTEKTNLINDTKAQVAGGDANIYIGGQINSTGDVVLEAGNGIYFYNGGIIDTTGKLAAGMDGDNAIGFIQADNGEQLASVSLFANTGDILEFTGEKLIQNEDLTIKGETIQGGASTNDIKIKSGKSITLSAKNGGIGQTIKGKKGGELKYVAPINVSIKNSTDAVNDGALNITVATTPALDTAGKEDPGSFKGYAAVANNTQNLNVGDVIGHNVKIQNKGFGTLATTKDIGTKTDNKSNVGTLYLDAQNGALNVNNNITTNNIIRLNGQNGVEATGNLNVLDNGYISVYSGAGAIDMNDAEINIGNIDIKAKGDVTHGNLKISKRPTSINGMLRLKDNETLTVGETSPTKTFRPDGIHVTSDADITQKAGTAISSAGIVELSAGGNVKSTIAGYVDSDNVKKDVVMITAKDAEITTTDVVRLGTVKVDNLIVNAGAKDSNNAITNKGAIVVDDAVQAKGNITINATDKVTIRPHVSIEEGADGDGTKWSHYTYGKIESLGGDIDITADNGIFAVNPLLQNDASPVSASLPVIVNKNMTGKVNLKTASNDGDIKVIANTDGITPTDNRLTIAAAGVVNAEGQNVNINLVNGADENPRSSGVVGTIIARGDANIGSVGQVLIKDQINAKNDVIVNAVGNILQDANAQSPAIVSGNDMTLTSDSLNIGANDNYLTVDVNGDGVLTANAKGNIYIRGLDELNVAKADAGNNLAITTPNGSLTVANAKAGNDLTITAQNDAKIAGSSAQNNAIVTAKTIKSGATATDTNTDLVTENGNITLKATAGDIGETGKHFSVGSRAGQVNAEAKAENANIYLGIGTYDTHAGVIEAANDVSIQQTKNIIIDNVVKGNNITFAGDGAILQNTALNTASIQARNDINLTSNNKNVGDPNKYLKISLGGDLDALAKNGGVYIEGTDNLNINKVEAKTDVGLKANGYIRQNATANPENPSVISGRDMTLVSTTSDVGKSDNYLQVKVGGKLDATAEHKDGNVYIGSKENLTIGKVVAGNDVAITGDGFIHQTARAAKDKPAITAGKKLTLKSNKSDVGDPNNYLSVKVGEALNATAPEGGVYIEGVGDLNIDLVQAKTNVGLEADGYIHQIATADPENPRVISGGNMHFKSANDNVGDPDNYLQVSVGGQLDASAPKGGVYIGSKGNLLVDEIKAGKDVGIETGGWIHETGNKKPAITSGGNMHLISFDDNVGDPNHYLTVKVGDKLDAKAPTEGKGVYIYGYGDLTIDRIEAAQDVGIKGNKDIILPSDKVDGNIIAGRDVIIEAGDNVLNGGGENLAIDAGRDIEVIANTNENNPAGSIGKLPYEDLKLSINVSLDGEVRADEIGVAEGNKILNIHIMGQDDGSGLGFDMDDRDQRNMKYLSDDDDSASVRNHRADLRYNVATSEYVLLDSNSDSGSKVQDVLNISKQGMLVQTDETPNVGDKMQVTMEYKGLPFTVEGTVVRTDAAKGVAGIKFNSIDQFTSSMILYLGMLNGR